MGNKITGARYIAQTLIGDQDAQGEVVEAQPYTTSAGSPY